MKLALVTIAFASLAIAGSALATPKAATLTIRHQLHGCHSWTSNGTTWKASQALRIARNGGISIVDNDVMPHTFIQVSGPKAKLVGASMRHMGAIAHVTFTAKGVYVFKTKAGEDYVKGVKTTGEDNVLRLVVTVV